MNAVFSEDQIFRIDHYLGKETVQNILFFRFGNGIFEPIWNRNYVERVEITIAETVGVEGRGPFYEKAGALRDILQNHAMEVLALIGMEPPESFQAEAVRSEKLKSGTRLRQFHSNTQYADSMGRGRSMDRRLSAIARKSV